MCARGGIRTRKPQRVHGRLAVQRAESCRLHHACTSLIDFCEKPSDFQRRQPSTVPIAMIPTSMSKNSSKFDTMISSSKQLVVDACSRKMPY